MDNNVLAWEKLRITAIEEETRSYTIASSKSFTPPNSLYYQYATDEALSFTNTKHVNKMI